jgi:hypothetical protein
MFSSLLKGELGRILLYSGGAWQKVRVVALALLS